MTDDAVGVQELIYPKPSISLSPSGGVPLGGAVTVRCSGWYQNMRFLLYKEGTQNALQDVEPAGDLAEFPICNVSRRDAGSYSCYYHDKQYQFSWSHPSDPVELVVAEPSYPKPKISLHPSGQVTLGGAVTIQCECRCRGARFLLSKAGEQDTQCSTDLVRDVAEFPICSVSQGDAGSYSCRYSTKWDPPIWSEPSDPVELVVAGGNNETQLETDPAPTRSGSTGPGTSTGGKKSLSTPPETEGTDPAGPQQPDPPTTEPEGEGRSERKLSSPIIAGVSVAAAGLLLLLLAFLCYRRTRGRKGPAPRQSRESEPATTVYALRGEGTQLDVLPQEPDPGTEGLTYAELDRQALQAKRGGPAPAPEPVLYAAINVS